MRELAASASPWWDQILSRNRDAIESGDSGAPVCQRAALARASASVRSRSSKQKALIFWLPLVQAAEHGSGGVNRRNLTAESAGHASAEKSARFGRSLSVASGCTVQ